MKQYHKITLPVSHNRGRNGKIIINKYQCDTCDRKFKLKRLLEKHRKSHEQIKKFVCEICRTQTYFLSPLKLKRHYKDVHPKYYKELKRKSKPDLKCEVCNKIFYSTRNLRNHKQFMHNEEIINDDDSQSAVENRTIPCENCNRSFSNELRWDTHRKEQLALTIIQCGYCFENFNYKCEYYCHVRHSHPGDRSALKCTTCDRVVTGYDILRMHELKCHPEKFVQEPPTDDKTQSNETDPLSNDNETVLNHSDNESVDMKLFEQEQEQFIEPLNNILVKTEQDDN